MAGLLSSFSETNESTGSIHYLVSTGFQSAQMSIVIRSKSHQVD
jgi:hypothetical protein